MAGVSNIEWTEHTWNPFAGCAIVSPGCTNCYAMKMAARLDAMGQAVYKGLTKPSKAGPVWRGTVRRASDNVLLAPLRRKKPTTYFVNSMSDLFYELFSDDLIDQVFAVMALSPQHTFQVLTKRAERMREYLTRHDVAARWVSRACQIGLYKSRFDVAWPEAAVEWSRSGLPNVWLGVSAERQQEADERIPLLLQTPAAVRFVSAEPLLGPIDLTRLCILPQRPGSIRAGIHIDALRGRYCESGVVYKGAWDIRGQVPPDSERRQLHWLIVGGESGPQARPMHPDWARSLRDQCSAAGVAFFFKQWGQFVPIEEPFEGRRHGIGVNYYNPNMKSVGKKAAGRLLDGVEWNEFPVTSQSRSEAA